MRGVHTSPVRRYTTWLGVGALGLTVAALFLLPPLGAWLVAINVLTFGAYGYDKRIAGSEMVRVPEAVLLGLALVGGSPGALLGMQLFKHKTRKGSFRAGYWAIVAVQAVLVIGWLGLQRGR